MDVKSALLNGYIKEMVYVEQPLGFEEIRRFDDVYHIKKVLYGLKQAPRAWYEKLNNLLINHEIDKSKVDTTLFIKRRGKDLFIVQIYVDDIIIGSANDVMCKDFAKMMKSEFKICLIGELNFLLRLQIKQSPEGTFIYIKRSMRKKQ